MALYAPAERRPVGGYQIRAEATSIPDGVAICARPSADLRRRRFHSAILHGAPSRRL